MQNNKLPKNFLKDNPLDELSTAMLTHFRMITITIPELNNQVSDVVVPAMEQSRLEQYQTEIKMLLKLIDLVFRK